jgi:hypothetical protein
MKTHEFILLPHLWETLLFISLFLMSFWSAPPFFWPPVLPLLLHVILLCFCSCVRDVSV